MSKELEDIDCNCSDCGYLIRSLSKRQKHVDFHFEMQKNHFNIKRIKLLEKGERRLSRDEKEKAKLIFKEARNMKFVFDEGSCTLHYGECNKLDKDVSFITNTCQLETQECFIHRLDPLEQALIHPIWKAHKPNESIYFMDGNTDRWKIVYYPIFQDGNTQEYYNEPRALMQNIDKDCFWSKEVPLRYLT